MCEFCDPKYIETPIDATVYIEKFGETCGLCFRVHGEAYGFAIYYCPICGRQLVGLSCGRNSCGKQITRNI